MSVAKVHTSNSVEESRDFKWIRKRPGQNGAELLAIGRTRSDYLIRYHGVADYEFSPSNRSVSWQINAADSDIDRAVHLGMNQVVPMALSTQDRLLLHASAIRLSNGTVVAFSGPSGIGKSTLARSLSKRDRIQRVADDWISIETGRVPPRASAYPESICDTIDSLSDNPSNRSLPETAQQREFHLDEIESHKSDAHPLSIIYILREPATDNRISINRLGPKQAFVDLAKNLFRLDPSNHKQLHKEVALLTELLKSTSVFSLSYPRRKDRLTSLIKQVLTHRSNE